MITEKVFIAPMVTLTLYILINELLYSRLEDLIDLICGGLQSSRK